MTHNITSTQQLLLQLQATGSLPIVAKIAVEFAATITKWNRNQRTRIQLDTLTDEQLSDIGITRHQAQLEVQKGFWE